MKISFEKCEDSYEKLRLKEGFEELWSKNRNYSILSSSENNQNEELLWGIIIKPGLSKSQAKKELGKICTRCRIKPSELYKINKERLYYDDWEGLWVLDDDIGEGPMIDCWIFEPKKEIRY